MPEKPGEAACPWPCERGGYSGRMRLRPSIRTFLPAGLALVLGLVAALFFLLDEASSPGEPQPIAPATTPTATTSATTATEAVTPTPTPTANPAATDTPVPTPTTPPATPSPSPTATPSPAPTATPPPSRTPVARGADPGRVETPESGESREGRPERCASVAGRGAALIEAVEDAMTEYQGVWGLALIDLDCDSAIIVRPQHSQYPASAGKIVILTAALRAVQESLLDFAAIEENVELVLHYSLDKSTDEIAELVTPEQVGAVMTQAGVSWYSSLEWSWRHAWFRPHDLALVWASILRGEQLDEAWTAHLLQLASEVVLPQGMETFPADFGAEGFQYGQKAGYWTPEDDTDHFVGAGYVFPEDRISAGFTFAFLLESWEEEVEEPKRRAVFPLVRDFVVGEVELSRQEQAAVAER